MQPEWKGNFGMRWNGGRGQFKEGSCGDVGGSDVKGRAVYA